MNGGSVSTAQSRWWVRYGLAVVFVAAASGLGRAGSAEWSSSGGHPYLIAWPAIMVAAWVGGLGPGLVATALSVLEIAFSVAPFGPFRPSRPGDLLAAFTFGACGVVVSILTQALHTARRKEERARRDREEVLAIVAHDLRNPLSTIIFTAADLHSNPDRVDRGLDRIDRAAKTMERLVRDLLDASVLDRQGELSVTLAEEDLPSLVTDAVEAASGPAAQRSVEIVSDLPATLPRVRCDRNRILQVLGNLVGNAMKFSPEGGRIVIRAVVAEGFVRIEVADTGPGIPVEDRPLVFVRHWSGSSGTGGVGLGLYIAHGIVHAHGGRMWLRSEVGRGTSFFVTLPAVTEPRPTSPQDARAHRRPAATEG